MPEKSLLDGVSDMWPWLSGLAASIIGVALRNEWTTNRMARTIYADRGEVRLVNHADCERCRDKCQDTFQRLLDKEHDETRQALAAINDKLDCMPKKIMALWKVSNNSN